MLTSIKVYLTIQVKWLNEWVDHNNGEVTNRSVPHCLSIMEGDFIQQFVLKKRVPHSLAIHDALDAARIGKHTS